MSRETIGLLKQEPWRDEMGTQTINYLWKPRMEEYFREYKPHGLEYSMQNVWGLADGKSGKSYFWSREIGKELSTFVFWTRRDKNLEATSSVLFDQSEIFSGYVMHFFDPKQELVHIEPQYPQGNYFTLDIKPGEMHFVDVNGKADLQYKSIVSETHTWYCPGEVGTLYDSMYRHEQMLITGTIDGDEVSGWGGLDSEWEPVGVGLRQAKRFAYLEKFWLPWYTEYEDGTFEAGCYVRGIGNHACQYLILDGKARIPKKHHLELEQSPDGRLKKALIYFDDEVFEFVPEALVAENVCAVSDKLEDIKDITEDASWVSGYVKNTKIKKQIKRAWGNVEIMAKRCLKEGFKDMR